MGDLELSIKLKADGSGLVGEVKVSREEIDRLTGAMGKTGKEAGKMAGAVDRSGRAARKAAKGYTTAAKGVRSISDQLSRTKRELIAFIGVTQVWRGFKAIVNTADQFSLLNSRLKLVTSSTEELTQVQQALFEIAQTTRGELEGTIDTYSRLARSTKELGLSQGELLAVTTTINQAVTVSGASAQSASAALFQLGQGLAAGALRGEELNSVMEQTPRLAEAIARGMGVTIGKLRTLGAEGKITAREVITALLSQRQVIEREFSQMPITVGQAMTQMENSLSRAIGEFDRATGASKMLARAIQSVSDAISGVPSDPGELLGEYAAQLERITRAHIAGMRAGQKESLIASLREDIQRTLELLKGPEGLRAQISRMEDELNALRQKRAASLARLNAMTPGPERSKRGRRMRLTDYGQAKKEVAELDSAIAELAATLELSTDRLFDMEAQADSLAIASNTLAKSNKDLSQTTNDLTKEQSALLDVLFPEKKRMRDYLSGLKELEKIQRKLRWSDEQLVKAAERLAQETLQAGKATEKLIEDTDKLSKTISPVAQIYEDTASSIRQSFRDTFRDVFDNGLNGFKGFAQRMENVFKDMLADMATLAIARPIIISMVSGMGSMMGMPQAARAGVMQQLGANAVGSAAGSTATSAVGNAGWLGLGNFGSQGISGSWYGSYVPYAAAGIGGAMFGNAYSRGDNRATAAGGIGAAVGFGVGNMLLPGAGGYIGAIIGGAIGGSAFGSKTRTDRRGVDLDVTGTSVSGRQWEDKSRRRSFFRGTARWREYSELDNEIRTQIETTFATIRESVYEFGTALDRDLVSRLNGFRTSYSGELKNLSDWISDVTEDMLRTALPGLEQFRRAGEETQAVVQRLSQTLGMMESLTTSIGAQLRLLRGESTPFDESARTIRGLWEKLGNTSDIQQRISLENDLYQQIMQRYQSEMSMIASVTDALGTTLTNIEFGNQTPNQQLAALQSSFESLLQQSQNLAGTELASVAQQLNQLASPLLNTARQLYASGAGYQSVYDLITGGLGDVRQRLVASGETKREQTISNLEQISRLVNAERDKLTENSAGNVNISLKIVTPDGRELKQETLDDILRRSRAGEIVIDARGVAS